MTKATKARIDKKLLTITQKLTDLLAEVDKLEESADSITDREELNILAYRLNAALHGLNFK